MYLDVVIVIALIIFAVCWFRRFSKFVYAFSIIYLFFRLIHFIAENLKIHEFAGKKAEKMQDCYCKIAKSVV